MSSDIKQYYSQRAFEYEKIYQKPERREELKKLKGFISKAYECKDVLEIACGTGYWTQFIAEKAYSIFGIDDSEEVLHLARRKDYKKCRVSFSKTCAYSLKNVDGSFNGGFCGFWWSHIPKSRVKDFIKTFHSKLSKDALVVVIDNKYVKGNSTPISRTDSDGNTYQIRKLENGKEYEVLKNYPDEREIRSLLNPHVNNIQYISYKYYWLCKYYVNNNI